MEFFALKGDAGACERGPDKRKPGKLFRPTVTKMENIPRKYLQKNTKRHDEQECTGKTPGDIKQKLLNLFTVFFHQISALLRLQQKDLGAAALILLPSSIRVTSLEFA
jgi:hypothetical protein